MKHINNVRCFQQAYFTDSGQEFIVKGQCQTPWSIGLPDYDTGERGSQKCIHDNGTKVSEEISLQVR